MKRILVIIGIFAVLVVILIVFLTRERSGNSNTLKLSGTVEAVETNLAFKYGGQIASIEFDEGDRVASGDTVAELVHDEVKAQIQLADDRIVAARARLQSLKIEKESAERNLKKVTKLVPAGGATENQKEDLQDKIRGLVAGMKAASAEIGSAKSQKDLLLVNLQNEYLVSPISGDILLRSAEPGEIAKPGQTVLTAINDQRLKIKVYIPEEYLGRIRIGQEVSIFVDSYNNRKFSGTITNLSSKAEFTPKNIQTKDERVKTVYAVTVRSDSQGGILKPGMPCDVSIVLEPAHD